VRNFKDEIWGCVCQDYLHIVKKLKQEMRLKVFASTKPGNFFSKKEKPGFLGLPGRFLMQTDQR